MTLGRWARLIAICGTFAAGAAGTSCADAPSEVAAPYRPTATSPINVARPAGPPRIASDLVDGLGRPITVGCATCHSLERRSVRSTEEMLGVASSARREEGAYRAYVTDEQRGDAPQIPVFPTENEPFGAPGVGDPTRRTGSTLTTFHQGLVTRHGDQACRACHQGPDYAELHLADGAAVAFTEVQTLCRQCHGPQARDFDHGAHGGMNGYWDLSRGPRERHACTTCHDPHAPAYVGMMPARGPVDPRHTGGH